jgi:hypothetical protein
MILVRNVFQLKFGKAKEAVALLKEGLAIQKRAGVDMNQRMMTDMVGNFYTLVLELTVPNMAALEANMPKVMGDKDWQAIIRSFLPWSNLATVRFSPSWSRLCPRVPFPPVSSGNGASGTKIDDCPAPKKADRWALTLAECDPLALQLLAFPLSHTEYREGDHASKLHDIFSIAGRTLFGV